MNYYHEGYDTEEYNLECRTQSAVEHGGACGGLQNDDRHEECGIYHGEQGYE